MREGSINDFIVSLDDVFTKGLKSPMCLHIFVNCMKNIEAKIKDIWAMNRVTSDNRIKSECQLRDLFKLTEFYNENFDEFENDNSKKEEKINELEKA